MLDVRWRSYNKGWLNLVQFEEIKGEFTIMFNRVFLSSIHIYQREQLLLMFQLYCVVLWRTRCCRCVCMEFPRKFVIDCIFQFLFNDKFELCQMHKGAFLLAFYSPLEDVRMRSKTFQEFRILDLPQQTCQGYVSGEDVLVALLRKREMRNFIE